MQATIDAIIDASSLPLSILIVGIGEDEFGKMKVSGLIRDRSSSAAAAYYGTLVARTSPAPDFIHPSRGWYELRQRAAGSAWVTRRPAV